MRNGPRLLLMLAAVAACGESTAVSTPPTAPAATTIAESTTTQVAATMLVTTVAATAVSTSTPEAGNELAGTWHATAGVVNDAPVELIETAPITMTFDGAQLSGTAACNEYGFTVTVTGTEVTVVDGYVNAVGCEPAVSALQDVFLGSIGPTATFEISNELLTWKTATATWTLAYVPPTPDLPLVDTAWTLNGVVHELYAMSTPWISESTIVFTADGTVAGSTGCRDFTGTWSLDGDRIGITNVDVLGTCDGERSEVDGVVEQVLTEGFGATIDGAWLRARPGDNLGLDYLANG